MGVTYTTTMDEKGRLVVPSELRRQFKIGSGDAVFLQADEDGLGIRLAKAVNPFDALADHAVAEHAAGRTPTLQSFAAEQGIDLDSE